MCKSLLKFLAVTLAEPHREKQVLNKLDILKAAVLVGKNHFKLGPHCPGCVEQERLLEAGNSSQIIDHSCERMMELSIQERCNHLCELWNPGEILEKCEDEASNMDWCVEEVQKNFSDKQWLEDVVKCCFFCCDKEKKNIFIYKKDSLKK